MKEPESGTPFKSKKSKLSKKRTFSNDSDYLSDNIIEDNIALGEAETVAF